MYSSHGIYSFSKLTPREGGRRGNLGLTSQTLESECIDEGLVHLLLGLGLNNYRVDVIKST